MWHSNITNIYLMKIPILFLFMPHEISLIEVTIHVFQIVIIGMPRLVCTLIRGI